MVIRNKIYTIESYCEEFFGIKISTKMEQDELRNILDSKELEYLADYPLEEINDIVDNDFHVVLVDTSYYNEKHKKVTDYRWFEVLASA